ncbi:hypothetical protein PanWU01x14_104450, partial [Parasponia andersonii]
RTTFYPFLLPASLLSLVFLGFEGHHLVVLSSRCFSVIALWVQLFGLFYLRYLCNGVVVVFLSSQFYYLWFSKSILLYLFCLRDCAWLFSHFSGALVSSPTLGLM